LQKDRILPTGLPRCDAFFLNNEDVFITQLHKKFPKSKIFLYMPTFRMTSKMDGDVFSPFSEKFGFGEEVFVNFLEKNNIVFLYKPHFVDSSVDVSINSNRFKLLKDNDFSDLYVLLNNIDILVTDYSSVYFDFLVTNKPIYLLTFDYYNYIENSRSHFFDMKKEMHGIFCNTWNDFYESLEIQFDLNKLKIDRLKFASYLDGKSSFKLVEKILEERL
jgi:CDP-glycerol glycerophosphotransferase